MALAVSDIKFGISTDGPPVTNTGVLVVDGTKIDSLGGNTTHTIGIQATGVIGNVANTGTLTSQTDAYILGSSSASSYGIQSIGTDGSVFNSGSINVDAHGVYTQAYGISAGTTGNIENSGRITVRAHSGGSTAVGIAAETEGHVINSGTMSITADSDLSATATGVDAGVLGSVSNSGSINVTAHSSEDDAQARGLYVSAPEIDNSGSINVSASAEESAIAHGILSYSSGMSAIMNSGTIAATANGFEAISYGIWTPYSADITNAGRIDADSSGFFAASAGISVGANGMEGAKAYSVEEASDFGLSTISNEGAITAQSLGGYVSQAVGIIASETSDIDNFGTITASASLVDQEEMSVEENGSPLSGAIGIMAMDSYGDITNSGDITASTDIGYGAFAAGIYVIDEYSEEDGEEFSPNEAKLQLAGRQQEPSLRRITNTGSISVDSDYGACILVGNGDWDIYNPGFVYTTNQVRTLYVGQFDMFGPNVSKTQEINGFDGPSASATLVGPFSAMFHDDPESEEYAAPILVAHDGYLDLNDATLIAQAGANIVWNTPYPVIENDGYVEEDSAFSGLQSANPNITVSWWDQEETGEDSAVVFEYTPQGSTPAGAMRLANMGAIQNSNLIQQRSFSQILAQHIKQQEILLADSGQTASDSGFLVAKSGQNLENAVFLRPYLKSINRDEDDGMGYRGELLGMLLGYERMLSPELTVGLHGGFGLGYLDYEGTGFDSNEETMTIYSLGMHGAYNPGSLHFDGSATLYAANHEYEGLTGGGLEIDEEDDYMSYGAEVEALGGYVFSSGQWAAMPYLGLGYSWVNAPSHSTDADDPAWDTHYGSVDEHILRSILGAQVSANWLLGETKVVPTAGLRWEYALTDNDIAVSQSLLGSPSVTVKDDIARSSLIADLSIAFSKNAASLELGAMGQYNEDFTALGGWLTLKYAF
jgi:hypothetical protein